MVFHDFHSGALRKGRVSIGGQVYLVTTATHNRQPLFQDLPLGRIVVNAMKNEAEKGLVDSLAFVVMPDHLHWLLALTGKAGLSEVMRSVKGFSAFKMASVRGRNAAPTKEAPIWQKGFHDHALRRDEELEDIARYVVLNPVRAGLVSSVWQYSLWDAIWINGE